jgi:hypothetical protein
MRSLHIRSTSRPASQIAASSEQVVDRLLGELGRGGDLRRLTTFWSLARYSKERRRRRGRTICSSRRLAVSPISQNMGGHRPTKIARRSALPRSSSPMVLARIHRAIHSMIDPSDVA